MWGGGGAGGAMSYGSSIGYSGGSGGYTTCALKVSANQAINIIVGGGAIMNGYVAISPGGFGGGGLLGGRRPRLGSKTAHMLPL